MSQRVSLASGVRICQDVLSRDLQGEEVILDLNTGVYFGLDQVGTRIWQLIREHRSLQQALDSMLQEYEVTKAQCTHDLLCFVTQMADKGLVEVRNGEDT
ncbi:PqqD family protein [Candidatus Methylomirabilis sp.]|uniref:PqqD family protein n=1 Tax=Candidatus Methylomirabilis sp. TaxID=2032687 RepID=UPI002A5B7CD0|nr:PqqD family protein [Candidatus Methylomirabilis sp.]